jgi:hypothetical protein
VQQLTASELLNWVKDEFEKEISSDNKQIIITAGAGDIDQLVTPLKEILATF